MVKKKYFDVMLFWARELRSITRHFVAVISFTTLQTKREKFPLGFRVQQLIPTFRLCFS